MNAYLTELLGNLLGLREAQKIEGFEPSLGATWAQNSPAWLFFGLAGLAAVAIVFYLRYQRRRRVGTRVFLAVLRGAALGLILLLLAEPILTVTVSSQKPPSLWLLVDGTDSMAIADELSGDERALLAQAAGIEPGSDNPGHAAEADRKRIDYVKSLVAHDPGNLLERLAEKARLRAFLFDRPEGARMLDLTPDGREGVDGEHLAGQLTTEGDVTALGDALDHLARRQSTANLAGLVILSDFNENAGRPALSAAEGLGVPVYTVGVGATKAVDVSVRLEAPLHVKQDERTSVQVTLRHEGLEGESVEVELTAEHLGGLEGGAGAPESLGKESVTLTAAREDHVDFPYVPQEAGRFLLRAEVAPVPGEIVEENNSAGREITVTDQFVRILFVEYEPTWEWRFVKEVFHRDKLVGMEGFRTFLRSSDPKVREANPMFLSTTSPSRSEFFEYDVIFLGDLPTVALSPRFCEMAHEFVRDFGGGLVILSGPRFGPGELAETPLARALPVVPDPALRIDDNRPFRPQLTPDARRYPFMKLGAGEWTGRENQQAWDNLGELPWYQPVQRLHALAEPLAVHPSQTGVDGKPQPLIAIRRYGRGEVIYFAFNETWRLRKKYGEKYYRPLWGQLIHRLALSHALGSQKRFVVSTDRRHYRADEEVILTVEAYDTEFEPLKEENLADGRLSGELVLPAGAGPEAAPSQDLAITQRKPGTFEIRFPVFAGGEHRVRVTDPVTNQPVETAFQVTSVTVERQRAVRNVHLQQQIANATRGKSYDLATVGQLADDVELRPQTETSIEVIPLWNTWFCFIAVVGLLLSEWFVRKWVNLQ